MKALILIPLAFTLSLAAERYGVYDVQGRLVSTFEAEWFDLPEKTRQVKRDNPQKKLYVSSFKKGKGSKPSSRYNFKTGAYIEASRKEVFSLCPSDRKTEGTWISEHSVSLDEKNCLSVQAPDLAGTFRILFMENSGLTDTIQVLVEQSYIQMGDYSHKIYVVDTAKIKSNPNTIYIVAPGSYESRSYSQPLIVDKTKFTMGDAWYYYTIMDTIFDSNNKAIPLLRDYELKQYPENEKFEGSRLPFIGGLAWCFANERSKKEGLDTVYYKTAYGDIALDTSASGYRLPFEEEWFFLMRAGAPTKFFWGDEDPYQKKEDSLKISRYVWINPLIYPSSPELKPVAQLLPNGFGLYDMVGITLEFCNSNPESFLMCGMGNGRGGIVGANYKSFRFIRKTPNLHKLEKF